MGGSSWRRWFAAPVALALGATFLFGGIAYGMHIPALRHLHGFPQSLQLDYSPAPFRGFVALTRAFISSVLGYAIDSGSLKGKPPAPLSSRSSARNRVVLEHGLTNDRFQDAIEVPSVPFTAKTNTTGASRESGEPASCSPIGGTVWYRYKPDSNIGLVADTLGSDHATALGIFTGDRPPDLRQIDCHSDARGNSRLAFIALADTTYHFQISAPVAGGRVWFNLEHQGYTTRATVSSRGSQGDHSSGEPWMSWDGRWLVFTSMATNLESAWRAPAYAGHFGPVADWQGCRESAALGFYGDVAMSTFTFTRPCIKQVYVRDRLTHRTTLISVSTDGKPANGYFTSGNDVSGDGRHVLFVSDADNLVEGDTNGHQVGGYTYGGGPDLFVRDRDTDGNGIFDEPGRARTTRVSVSSDGRQANEGTHGGGISADGRYVVFMSQASNLVPGDTNRALTWDTFLHDRDADGNGILDEPGGISTERVGVGDRGQEAFEGTFQCGYSRDARYIGFRSQSDNLVPGDNNGKIDTFVRDRVAKTTERVSLTWDGKEQNGDSESATSGVGTCLSDDGRYAAFLSSATNLVREPDTNNVYDLFVRDRLVGDTRRVSVGWDGRQADAGGYRLENPQSLFPQAYMLAINRAPSSATGYSITPDGRYVVFSSPASNLVPGDNNGFEDVFLRDLIEETTIRVSVSATGEEGNLYSTAPRISEDGRFVAFASPGSNLVSGDTNEVLDIFVRELGGPWGRSGWH